MSATVGELAYQRIRDLFPLCRSITGEGVRQTLQYIANTIPDLRVRKIKSGTQIYDWTVPDEWSISQAYIEDESGNRIVDFRNNNLHVVNYSMPVDCTLSLQELQKHLHSREDMPNAIPYVTSYYEPEWGFCLEHTKRQMLKDGHYKVRIDSKFTKGHLNYADCIIKGKTKKEILISTYICHPSMANNELSGPAVALALAEWLKSRQKELHFTYRFVFVPETIGAIAYIHQNFHKLKQNVVAGYVLTCIGDRGDFSFMPTPWEDTYADRMTQHVLHHCAPGFIKYSFLERGSDERQYCSPRVSLPVVSVMRSKYRVYKEYHTSLDNLDFVSADALTGSIELMKKCILAFEYNKIYRSTVMCEPMLSKRDLYFNSSEDGADLKRILFDFIAYCDGQHDLLHIAEKLGINLFKIQEVCELAIRHKLVKSV